MQGITNYAVTKSAAVLESSEAAEISTAHFHAVGAGKQGSAEKTSKCTPKVTNIMLKCMRNVVPAIKTVMPTWPKVKP